MPDYEPAGSNGLPVGIGGGGAQKKAAAADAPRQKEVAPIEDTFPAVKKAIETDPNVFSKIITALQELYPKDAIRKLKTWYKQTFGQRGPRPGEDPDLFYAQNPDIPDPRKNEARIKFLQKIIQEEIDKVLNS